MKISENKREVFTPLCGMWTVCVYLEIRSLGGTVDWDRHERFSSFFFFRRGYGTHWQAYPSGTQTARAHRDMVRPPSRHGSHQRIQNLRQTDPRHRPPAPHLAHPRPRFLSPLLRPHPQQLSPNRRHFCRHFRYMIMLFSCITFSIFAYPFNRTLMWMHKTSSL